jgi:hypothetical protein
LEFEVSREMLAAEFEAIFPRLDERRRRLLMGAEARALGRGGIRLVARAARVREAAVSAGVDELDAGAEPLGRVRRVGGGPKRAVDLDPGLRPALLALVEPEGRGDPMSPLRWTTKSTRTLAFELARQGRRVGADTVADVLRAGHFSLRGNAKTLEGARRPDRDRQFRRINDAARGHLSAGDPVISVDTKKEEELVGQCRDPGRRRRPAGDPVKVDAHGFPDAELGRAIPRGVCDLAADAGWVTVGTDHDTAAFAVGAVRRWWDGGGRAAYPGARRLLTTADAGGSDGCRTRAWKAELAALALDTGLEITVCHFPPGASTWDKAERRRFSHITMNWAGRPLASHEVILNSIAATTTHTGLTVTAELDTASCETGAALSDKQMAALPIDRRTWHGDWNCTLRPEPPAPAPDPVPFDEVSPQLAWLCHPALTGMDAEQSDAQVRELAAAHAAQREGQLDQRRGGRPRIAGSPTTGRPPTPTLGDRGLATVLRHRMRLPQAAIATLFTATPTTINRRIRDIRQLLTAAGHTITPTGKRLTSLEDLHALADMQEINRPREIKTACQ